MEPEFSSTGRLLQMCAKKNRLSYGNDEMAQNPVPLVNTKIWYIQYGKLMLISLLTHCIWKKIAISLDLNQGKLGWSHHFHRFITWPLLLEEQPAVALSGGRQRVRSKQSGSFFRRFRSSYGRGALRYLASTDKQRIDRDGQGVECFGLVWLMHSGWMSTP